MELRIKGAVVTSAGNVRSGNEDNYYLFGRYRYDTNVNSMREEKESLAVQTLAAVYDGMGGEESGELASLTAARFFMPCGWENVQKEALRQVRCANEELCREIRKRGGSRIGTTAVVLYLDAGKAVCCNVGDSRCYLMRDGVLRQLSVDHSEAGNMIRMGVLDPSQARNSKSWHRLTQHLGIFPDEFVIEPHFSEQITLQQGDRFLLCSDGLTDMVLDDEIASILGSAVDAGNAVDELVKSALLHGGRDNVTAMVLEVSHAKYAKKPLMGLLSILVAVCIGIGIGFGIASAAGGQNADQPSEAVSEEEPETIQSTDAAGEEEPETIQPSGAVSEEEPETIQSTETVSEEESDQSTETASEEEPETIQSTETVSEEESDQSTETVREEESETIQSTETVSEEELDQATETVSEEEPETPQRSLSVKRRDAF